VLVSREWGCKIRRSVADSYARRVITPAASDMSLRLQAYSRLPHARGIASGELPKLANASLWGHVLYDFVCEALQMATCYSTPYSL